MRIHFRQKCHSWPLLINTTTTQACRCPAATSGRLLVFAAVLEGMSARAAACCTLSEEVESSRPPMSPSHPPGTLCQKVSHKALHVQHAESTSCGEGQNGKRRKYLDIMRLADAIDIITEPLAK